MKIPSLQELHDWIVSGDLLPAVMFVRVDYHTILKARDSDHEFEEVWLAADKELEAKWQALVHPAGQEQLEEDVRREAYLATIGATQDSDLAACVSDDFGLIAYASVLGDAPSIVARLWNSYVSRRIPGPETTALGAVPET